MGTMFIKISRKTKTEMAQTSRRRFKEDESEKQEREVYRQKTVERNCKAGQNPPRVAAPNEEEEEEEYISVLTTALFNNTFYYEMTGSSYRQMFHLYDESSRHST